MCLHPCLQLLSEWSQDRENIFIIRFKTVACLLFNVESCFSFLYMRLFRGQKKVSEPLVLELLMTVS